MRKIFLLLFTFAAVVYGKAQHNHSLFQPYKSFSDTGKIFPTKPFLKDVSAYNFLSKGPLRRIDMPDELRYSKIDRMPVIGYGSSSYIYAGNNNNGFDIYQASPDNMYILKPDSTFYSHMPTGNPNQSNPLPF